MHGICIVVSKEYMIQHVTRNNSLTSTKAPKFALDFGTIMYAICIVVSKDNRITN